MKTQKITFILLLILLASINGQARAQRHAPKSDSTTAESRLRNAISFCPGGIFLGIYSINFERMLKPHHGLVFRMDYENVPRTYSEANLETYGLGAIVNYRYHLNGKLESSYLGAFGRIRGYMGHGSLGGTRFDYTIPEVTLGFNAGKRWIWKSGFTLNFALGYGHIMKARQIKNNSSGASEAVDVFEKKYDFINGFLGEFSIGYAF